MMSALAINELTKKQVERKGLRWSYFLKGRRLAGAPFHMVARFLSHLALVGDSIISAQHAGHGC